MAAGAAGHDKRRFLAHTWPPRIGAARLAALTRCSSMF